MTTIQNIIQFILDDEIITIDFKKQELSPTLTVLNYLRSLPNHKGVKEGCAEGDCGACTVVIAELINNKLSYKAVNSCLVFLPMLHGKQLITVENLAIRKINEVRLHPVQKTIVDLNGSQCGYCTPGIAMSMFALFKNSKEANPEIIEDSMTGNLCRCTGYKPIYDAALKVCTMDKSDHFYEKEELIISLLKTIKNSSVSISSLNQKYFQPKSKQEALSLINEHPNANLVNGSTDIALKQTKKFETLKEIIDLSAIDSFKTFEETEDKLLIGAGINLETLRRRIPPVYQAFQKMLQVFASKQIRELATLGGNIGTASPIGDAIPLLMAFNAELKIISQSYERVICIEKFIKGYRETDLQKGELIDLIIIPNPKNKFIGFYKVSKRKDLDISTVSAGFRLSLKNNKVSDICLAFGGVAEMPKRASLTEKFIKGKEWSGENIEKAAKILYDEFTPISDARSGIEFRKIATKNLLIKFFKETKQEYASA